LKWPQSLRLKLQSQALTGRC